MDEIEKLRQAWNEPSILQPVTKRSTVYIHIELGCEKKDLKKNLKILRDSIEVAKKGTNDLYENTRVPLSRLLNTAIEKIPEERTDFAGTIQIEPLQPFNGWGCSISLATYDQPHLTSD